MVLLFLNNCPLLGASGHVSGGSVPVSAAGRSVAATAVRLLSVNNPQVKRKYLKNVSVKDPDSGVFWIRNPDSDPGPEKRFKMLSPQNNFIS